MQHEQQTAGIFVHWADSRSLENLGKGSFHYAPIFQDVGNSGRTSEVIFQDVKLPVPVADQVGPGNVTPDPLGGIEPHACFSERAGRTNQIFRNDFISDDFLFVIDVVDKKIESVNALLEASFDPVPFGRFDDAWNNVKRKDFFRGRAIAVNVKGDAALQQ